MRTASISKMKMMGIILLVLPFLVPAKMTAQEEMKWGKVPKEQLTRKTYARDRDAGAVVLGDYGQMLFDLRSTDRPVKFDRHVRIKYLTADGIHQHGSVSVRYNPNIDDAALSNLKAQVYLRDGQEIDVKKEDITTTVEQDGWTTVTITFPDLDLGAVAEYKYTLKSADFDQPVNWQFQRDIPVVVSDLKVQFPEWFEYITLRQGRLRVEESYSMGTDFITGVNFSGYSRLNFMARTMQNALRVKVRTDHYVATNVPALRPQSFITTMDDYYSGIVYQLQTLRLPEAEPEAVMHSWNQVAAELLEDENFGKAFKSPRNGEAVLQLANVTAGTTSDQKELAMSLYVALSNTLEWNNVFTYKTTKAISTTIRDRNGTSADLNLALLSGLTALGIEASPVLTSTRTHGMVIEKYPVVDRFNHVLVRARLDGEVMFLDLGGPLHPAGLPHPEALNYRGWEVVDDYSGWIDIVAPKSTSVRYFQLSCDGTGSLTGTLTAKYTGYEALQHRQHYQSAPQGYAQSVLHDFVMPLEISDLKVENTDNCYEPWSFTADVSFKGGTVSEDKMDITPVFSTSLTQSPFTAEERNFPVEYSYPEEQQWILDITIPEGYVVDSLPVSQKLGAENDSVVFTYRAGVTDGKIQIVLDVLVSNLRYGPHEYEVLKTLYDRLAAVASEPLVLKKQ